MSRPAPLTIVRWLLLLVIAWLIGVYVYELVEQNVKWVAAAALAFLTFVLNWYARRRATAGIKKTWQYYFWIGAPGVVIMAAPLLLRWYLGQDEETPHTWSSFVAPVWPALLKVGVPVLLLLLAYYLIGRQQRRDTAKPEDQR